MTYIKILKFAHYETSPPQSGGAEMLYARETKFPRHTVNSPPYGKPSLCNTTHQSTPINNNIAYKNQPTAVNIVFFNYYHYRIYFASRSADDPSVKSCI